MAEVEQTADEVMESMTGHDEMEVAQQFGRTISVLAEHDPSMLGRALVFITKRRAGLNDDEARNAAMDMRFKELMDYFSDPDEVSEEPGKGESVSAPPSPSSLSSVS